METLEYYIPLNKKCDYISNINSEEVLNSFSILYPNSADKAKVENILNHLSQASVDGTFEMITDENENALLCFYIDDCETLSSSYGEMPIAGYLSEIIKMVANMDVDGWDLATFVSGLSSRCADMEMDARYGYERMELYFIIDKEDNELFFEFSDSYNGLAKDPNKVHTYYHKWSDKTRKFRLSVEYTEDWGFDEIR